MDTLITEFNNLGGSSLSQHYTMFSRYMKTLDNLESNNRLHVLNNLKAVHRLEEIFFTKLLLRYGQTEKLMAVVLEGDRILNRIIGIYKPFPFQNLGIDAFKDLFPSISYITRTRYINNLSQSIERDDTGEEFFQWILSEYGIRAAVPFLCVCSEDFVLAMIKKYRIIFRERHLVTLHQRFGENLIKVYFEELAKYGIKNFNTQLHFARYLSHTDTRTFYLLLQYGQPKIGKAGFINFLKHYSKEIVTDPQNYRQIIKKKLLLKFLDPELYTQYFINALPKKIVDFCLWDILRDLELLPLKDRGPFMANCFREKYGFEIYNYQSTSLINYFHVVTLEERMKFHTVEIDENDMLEFYDCEKAFPLIRERLNLTSDINTRCELVLKLFKCAKHNDNSNALIEASQYLCQRHKTDNSSIRADTFLYLRDAYKMETLGADFWKYWEEIVYTEEAIVEYPIWYRDMLQVLLHYKYLNGIEIIADLKKWIKELGSNNMYLPTNYKPLQKFVLLKLPELLPLVFPDDPHNTKYPAAFLNALWRWNKDNPKEFISYYKYPQMIKMAAEHFDGNYYNDVIGTCVMLHHPTDPEESTIRDELFESFDKFSHHDTTWQCLIKKQLNLVEKYWEYLFNKRDRGYYEIEVFYDISKLHFTAIPTKIREKAMGILKDDSSEDYQIKIAVAALSYEPDFIDIVNLYPKRFYPGNDGGMNVFAPNLHDILDLREHICWCLRHVTQAHKLIEPVLKFCVKDYFSRAMPLLTYTLFNSPQTLIKQPLKILQTRSLTITKRAIYYCTCLFNNVDTCTALRVAGCREHSKSLQKFIFNRSFKAFCNICDTVTWNILLEHFKFIFEKDSETINMAFNFNLIPRPYVGQYVAKIWHTLGKSLVNHNYNRMLSNISADIMPLLSNDLCDDIIQFYLLNAKDKFRTSEIDFIYRYLLLSPDNMQYRFQLLANNTKKYLEDSSNEDFVVINKKRQNVWYIFNDICTRLLTDKETDLETRQRFIFIFSEGILQLPQLYTGIEFIIKAQVITYALANEGLLVPYLVSYFSGLEHTDDLSVQFYANIVKELLILINEDVGYILKVIKSLLELSQRTANANKIHMLAAFLLPRTLPGNEEHAVLFKSLVTQLQGQSPNISLIVSETLKNLSYSEQ